MIISVNNINKQISFGLYNFNIDSSWTDILEYKYNNETNYRSYQEFSGQLVQIIPILQIDYKIRKAGVPIFNNGENEEGEMLTAKERTLNIFAGFDNGEKIKPVILYRKANIDKCINLFNLYAGCHRLHCSIVYGFKMIPAIIYRKTDLITT